MTTELKLIKGYFYEGRLSMDKDFVYELSGGKCKSREHVFLVSKDAYSDLLNKSVKYFDYKYYDSLLENVKNDEADSYLESHRIDIDLERYEFAHLVAGVDKKGIIDRKSTRLNSSHVAISYAVFCLK